MIAASEAVWEQSMSQWQACKTFGIPRCTQARLSPITQNSNECSQHSQAIQHRCPPNKNKIWLTVDCVQLSLNGDWFGAKAIFEVCWKFSKQTQS